jgi:hypothetical protein
MATVRNKEAIYCTLQTLCLVCCYIGDFKHVCTPQRMVESNSTMISPCSSPNYSRLFLSERENVRADSAPSVCCM